MNSTLEKSGQVRLRPSRGFTDVRAHQRRLKSKGLKLRNEAGERNTGPASFTLLDLDGNPFFVDQHV